MCLLKKRPAQRWKRGAAGRWENFGCESQRLALGGCVDDHGKVRSLEGRAANQAAVNIFLAQQLLAVLGCLLYTSLVQQDGSLGRVRNGAGTADAAAGAAHAFQKIAVVLAGLGQHQQLLALGQALSRRDLDFHVGVPFLDLVGNGLGNTAGLSKAAAGTGSVDQIDLVGINFQCSRVDILGLNDAGQQMCIRDSLSDGPYH